MLFFGSSKYTGHEDAEIMVQQLNNWVVESTAGCTETMDTFKEMFTAKIETPTTGRKRLSNSGRIKMSVTSMLKPKERPKSATIEKGAKSNIIFSCNLKF